MKEENITTSISQATSGPLFGNIFGAIFGTILGATFGTILNYIGSYV